MTNVLNVLLKAKQYLEQFGWRRDDYGNPQTGFCLTGAIRAAVDVTDDRVTNLPPILMDAYAAFSKPLRNRGVNVYRYTANLPKKVLTEKQLSLYREDFADEGDIIEWNDKVNKEDAMQLIDEAIKEVTV